jgi:hypothetical protein
VITPIAIISITQAINPNVRLRGGLLACCAVPAGGSLFNEVLM